MTVRIHLSSPAWIAALALAVGGLGLIGCAADDAGTAHDERAAPVGEATADVDYEPAYPEDVSAEDLSAEDTRQQGTPHSHDGEVHAHEGDGHAHDDEGEDHHEHGDDGHDHH